MTELGVRIDKKNVWPGLPYILKLAFFAVVAHFFILPLIFQTFTFFGELRSFWQSILTVVVAAWLANLFQIKLTRGWF